MPPFLAGNSAPSMIRHEAPPVAAGPSAARTAPTSTASGLVCRQMAESGRAGRVEIICVRKAECGL